ncbi:MAG: sulfotransferase [Bacteroidetes bacterium]|nr:sulfotransferase [Bacteroidota bacterium]
MTYLVAALSMAAFLLALARMHLVPLATSAFDTARKSVNILTNNTASDKEKEDFSRQAAKILISTFFRLTVKLFLATALALVMLFALSALVQVDISGVFGLMASLHFIIGSTALAILIIYMAKPRKGYSTFDRWFHRLAFATTHLQMDLYKADWKMDKARPIKLDTKDFPVFICGMPRAGTTAMLQLLHATNLFASHTYADMPFVPIPLLWKRFSHSFRSYKAPLERWHRDGVHISQSSPEALDEVVFRHLLSKEGLGQYNNEFLPADHKLKPQTIERLQDHFFRVAHARGQHANRYLSKNNAHVFRIPALTNAYSGAMILVMFRHPYHQAQSLLRQHRHFSNMQRRDPFVLKYMDHIGQQFFGLGMKKPGFVHDKQWKKNTGNLGFWVEYWQYVYGGILLQNPPERVAFVDFEDFIAHHPKTLRTISSHLDLPLTMVQSLAKAHIVPREKPPEKYQGQLEWEASHPEAMSIYGQLRLRAAADGPSIT